MRIISKDNVQKEAYINGNIVVCFVKDDEVVAKKEIISPLEENGYLVVPVEISPEACQQLYYVSSVKEKLMNSRCGIFVFSKALLEPQNMNCLQVIFYEYGLLESRNINVFPYILDLSADQLDDLFIGKPLSNIQGVTVFAKILDQIKELRLPKESYMHDSALNKLVLSRIKYVKITAIIEVRRDSLLQIWKDKEVGWGEDEQDFHENTMINLLNEELNVGAVVIRFGKEDTLAQEPFSPYREESTRLLFNSPAQYEKTIAPKRIEQDGDTEGCDDTITILKLEFIIPVHEILGTSFLPYLSVKRRSRWKAEHLAFLLENSQGLEKTAQLDSDQVRVYKDGKEYKVFFLLPGVTTKIDEDISSQYGRICNFIYPK